MKKLTVLLVLLLLGNLLCAQEWRIDKFPDSLNFAIENGYFKYEKVDVQYVPQNAMMALQRAKDLFTIGGKHMKIHVEDSPQAVIASLKRTKDLYNGGAWYTWFMNSNYMYMYLCYTVYIKDKDKRKDKYKNMYYLVTVVR